MQINPCHFSEIIPPDKPFLIVGKGPSFEKIHSVDREQYNIFACNHVATILRCYIGNCIDLDVLSEPFVNNSTIVLLPWHPHVNFKPTTITLQEHAKTNSYLQKALSEEKLFTYDLSTWKPSGHRHGVLRNYYRPTIHVKFFSGEAAFQILGYMGVKEIHSVGIDGGNSYSGAFRHLKPLTNGQKNFDKQFAEIEKTVKKYGIKWTRL